MQVLGELMKVKPGKGILPLPWYHRAALGHENNTTVSVAIVKNKFRNNYDILVTVLDPEVWSRAYRLSFKKKEGGGVVDQIYKSIHEKWDIILSESVAQEGGDYHITSIICEPKVQDVEEEIQTLKQKMGNLGFKVSVKPVFIDIPEIVEFKKRQVINGNVVDCGWIYDFLKKEGLTSQQCKVLVTADTRLRILRFIFCKENTVSFDIEHLEKQGTLKKITSILSTNKSFNILSSLSSKSAVRDQYARFRIVCEIESQESARTIEYVYDKIDELKRLEPLLSISIINHHSGKKASKLTYCSSPYDIVAKVPDYLTPHILKYKKKFPKNKFPVFISRRFIDKPEINKVVERVKSVLIDNNCHVVEAFPQAGDRTSEDIEVKSLMWLSRAGILLVNSRKKLGPDIDPVSLNLPQEYGFLDGQGKPILILQEGFDNDLSRDWSNLRGVKPTYIPDDESALNDQNVNSIAKVVCDWLKRIKNI